MGPSDSQRYTRLLLAKRREVSSAPGDARARVPAAGGWGGGDVIDRPMPMPRRSFRSACIKPTLVSYEQSKRHSLGSDRARMVYVWSARSLSLRLVWKQCRGRVSAASARSNRPPDPGKREAMRAYVLMSARWRMPTLRDELGLWEANRQDECPYPTRTLFTKCWAQEVPRDASLPEEKE
jgi:hypothetical protein